MKTYEFKSERNWDKAGDYLDELSYKDQDIKYTCYGYMALTVFNGHTENTLTTFCKSHRIAIKEI